MKSTAILLSVFAVVAASRRAAVACADYEAAAAHVDKVLRFEDESSLSDAYEALADAWLCAHADATVDQFAQWTATLSASAKGSASIPSAKMPHGLIVVWRRDDAETGGRAVLYRHAGKSWSRRDSMDLKDRPDIVATLGGTVLVGEFANQGDLAHVQLHAVRIDDDKLEDARIDGDLIEPRVRIRGSAVHVTYDRLPQRLNIEGLAPRLRYAMTIRRSKHGIETKKVALTPALDTLDNYCGAADTDARAKYVKGSRLASGLPSCDEFVVNDVKGHGDRYSIAISAHLVCVARDGTPTSTASDGSIVLARVGGRFRVVQLAVDGCRNARARRADDPI